MVTRSTLALALAVPGVVHIVLNGGQFDCYMAGELASLPAHAKIIVLSPAEAQAILDSQEPLLADLRDQAATGLATNATFQAIVTPNNAQLIAQAKALTVQNTKIINALLRFIAWRWGL